MKKNTRSGFTLPEILVTVTVIAVLAAVVVPAVTQFTTKGDAPATASDVSQVRNAISTYVSDTRHYPADFSDLVTNPPTAIANWKGPYFAGALSGVSGTGATFISNGAGATLGPAITSSGGYLTTNVTLGTGATCQDLINLDKIVDGGAGDGTSGNLQWTGTCTTALTTGTFTGTTLRLMTIGT